MGTGCLGGVERLEGEVIDLLLVTSDTAEALYRVVDAAYERRSIALVLEPAPAGFDEVMPKTIANATSTGSCTTPTSSSPAVTRSVSPTPPEARG